MMMMMMMIVWIGLLMKGYTRGGTPIDSASASSKPTLLLLSFDTRLFPSYDDEGNDDYDVSTLF